MGCLVEPVQFDVDDGINPAHRQQSAAATLADHHHRRFFRVLSKNPSAMKLPHTDVDIALASGQLAVACHSILNVDDAKQEAVVKMQALSSRSVSGETSFLLSDRLSIDSVERWSRKAELMYFSSRELDGIRLDEASKALDACVGAGAWEGEQSLELDISVAEHQNLHVTLTSLAVHGLVKCEQTEDGPRRSWQITKEGAGELQCGVLLHSPVKVSAPRGQGDPSKMTSWELITHLREDGWSVDQAKSASKLEPFNVQRKKSKIVWLNEKNLGLNHPYLQRLALHSSLKEQGIQTILHLQTQIYYNDILDAAGLRHARGRRKAVRRGALDLDDGGMGHKAAACVKPSETSRRDAAVGVRDGKGGKELKEPGPEPAAKKAKTGRTTHESSYKFGPHRMTFKPPSSWFAVCCRKVSHAKPDKLTTKCTRTAAFKGAHGGEDSLAAQRMLKAWLNLCQD